MGKAVAMYPTPLCPVCNKGGTVEIPIEKLSEVNRWRVRRHVFIQDLLPELDADQREMLISGTHPECWKELFGEES